MNILCSGLTFITLWLVKFMFAEHALRFIDMHSVKVDFMLFSNVLLLFYWLKCY